MTETVRKIIGREILDSRGNPTVEADVITERGVFRGAVPSGASTGSHEAVEKRDGGKRYRGKGVLQAVAAVNEKIAPALAGASVGDQRGVDLRMRDLDGTPNKGNFGANALLAVSIAVARAGAHAANMSLSAYLAQLADTRGVTLPIPQMNVINGGRHAGIDDDIQEHLILPVGAKSFREALQMGTEVYHALHDLIKERFGAGGSLLGDEGGFVPQIERAQDRLQLIKEAIAKAGYEGKIALGLDCAASEFGKPGAYRIRGTPYDTDGLIDFYEELVKDYGLISIEDPMHEEDWDGWQRIVKRLGDRVQIVGDDLLVTNVTRIEKAVATRAANALLLKVNQIGTVSEAIDAGLLAGQNGWNVVLSHRSGETEDTFISELAVALDASQSKFGAPARTDRTAKYNELLRIEERLGSQARYSRWRVQN